jgi:hypothetical protein
MTVIEHTLSALIAVTKNLAMGSNLALVQFVWMLVSGALLGQRGGLFPALKAIGLSDGEARRAWSAFRGGKWQIGELVEAWRQHIEGQAGWHAHRHEGYRALTVDVTAFFRPKLKACPSKHYHPVARRAVPAVIVGLVGEVGEIGGQRLALPRSIERVHPQDGREKRLWQTLLRQVNGHLAQDEIAVMDAGVKLKDIQAAGLTRYMVRFLTNFTARRNVGRAHTGRGRPPKYGELVRPLPRARKGKMIAATPPDQLECFSFEGRPIRAEIWLNVVRPTVVPFPDAPTFNLYAIHDPTYPVPWLLATPLELRPVSVTALYRDRWPVEQLPLAAKHMVGAHRQFVHADESIQRLPELALLSGSILSFLAATAPASPTGFWDTHPKPTPGRFRRRLFGMPFPKTDPLPDHFRKKNAATAHLPKGFFTMRPIHPVSSPQSFAAPSDPSSTPWTGI